MENTAPLLQQSNGCSDLPIAGTSRDDQNEESSSDEYSFEIENPSPSESTSSLNSAALPGVATYVSPTLSGGINEIVEKTELNGRFFIFLYSTIVCYILDVGSDYFLGITYFIAGEYIYGLLTFAVIWISSFVTTYISNLWFRLYLTQSTVEKITITEENGEIKDCINVQSKPKTFYHARWLQHSSKLFAVLYNIVVFLFQLAPLMTYFYVGYQLPKPNDWLGKHIIKPSARFVRSTWKYIRMSFIFLYDYLKNKPSIAEPCNIALENTNTSRRDIAESVSLQTPQRENNVTGRVPVTLKGHENSKIILSLKFHADYERMFECFVEAVPQIILQLTIICSNSPSDFAMLYSQISAAMIASIIFSVAGIFLSMYTYHANIPTTTFCTKKVKNPESDPINGYLFWLKVGWHACFVLSRIFIICCLLSILTIGTGYVNYWTSLIAIIALITLQWTILYVYLPKKQVGEDKNCLVDFLIHAAKSWIFVWVAISSDCNNPKSIYFYAIYYASVLVSSIGMYTLITYPDINKIYEYNVLFVVLCISFGLFCLSLIFQTIFYCKFNPKDLPVQEKKKMSKNEIKLKTILIGGMKLSDDDDDDPEMEADALYQGTDINSADETGKTAILKAAGKSTLQVLKILIKRGARLDIKDNDDCTLLICAARNFHHKVIEYVIDYCDFNINDKTKEGKTALHEAVACGHSRNVEILLNAHANMNVQDNKGNTPLHLAAMAKHLQCVQLLFKHGADRRVENHAGKTVLNVGSSGEYDNVKPWLIQNINETNIVIDDDLVNNISVGYFILNVPDELE